MNKCISCGKRKGKRICPALSGLICSECCGTRRIKEINCPPECTYLKDAQIHTIERVNESPTDFKENQWTLFLYLERVVYKFLAEFPGFTDKEFLEVLDLFEREYQTRRKSIYLPPLYPKSSRGTKLKSILQEEFVKLEKQENEFGLPIFTVDDFIKVISFEKARVERYQKENRNAGENIFLQILKEEVEYMAKREAEKAGGR